MRFIGTFAGLRDNHLSINFICTGHRDISQTPVHFFAYCRSCAALQCSRPIVNTDIENFDILVTCIYPRDGVFLFANDEIRQLGNFIDMIYIGFAISHCDRATGKFIRALKQIFILHCRSFWMNHS